MKPERANVYLIGSKYVVFNKRFYKLEELDDEGIAEAFNGGDRLPIIQQHEENN